jgi:nitroreductase
MSVELHPLLAGRFSARAFEPGATVNDAELASLLEAARWAPSSMNEQPWAFLVARREDGAAFETLLHCLAEGNQAWAKDAAVLLVACGKQRFDRNGRDNLHAWHDVGLAIMAMSVQGVSLGIQMREMGGIDRERTRQTYAIPEGWEVVSGLAVGRPKPEALAAAAQRQRKALPALAFQGAWGRPLALTAGAA